MAVAALDTLKFANALKAAGVPDKQAEAEASAIGEAFSVNLKELTTKDDLRSLKDELTNQMRETEQRLTAKIDTLSVKSSGDLRVVKEELTNQIRETEQRLNAKIDTLAAKNSGEMMLIKWMLGLSITLSVGILIRLFLVRTL